MAERVIHPSTPEEDARLNALAARFEADAPSLAARLGRMEQAECEPGIRGELRRVIREALISPRTLSEATGVDLELIHRFQEGTSDLPSAILERLARHLGLSLVLSASA
jgi:hypothetical protein